jgi:hypothetical protein
MHTLISTGRGRVVLACSAAVVLVVAVVLTTFWLTGSPFTPRGEASPTETPREKTPREETPREKTPREDRLPDGWRWESFGGIEVGVPETWEYGTTGTPPCLQRKGEAPYVGRPGPVALIGCVEQVPELANRTSFLWLGGSGSRPGVRSYDHGWVEKTRVVRGVRLTVFTDDASLREGILGSARVAGQTDVFGCPVDHRVAVHKLIQPEPSAGLAAIGRVRSMVVCRYMIEREGMPARPEPILSGSRLEQPDAQRLVDSILEAPSGGGPNNPSSCIRSAAYGQEVLVLHVTGTNGAVEIFFRHSGCDGHGIYDGATVRSLTTEIARPLLRDGPHRMTSGNAEIGELIWPSASK